MAYGRWTVQSSDSKFAQCACSCGTERRVLLKNLKNGRSRSCGCLNKEIVRAMRHGLPNGVCARNQTFLAYKRGADKRNLSFLITKEEFTSLSQQNCHYCGTSPNKTTRLGESRKRNGQYGVNGEFTYNGIDRKDNTIGYEILNCLPCCTTCNYAKSNKTYEDFLSWINNLILYQNKSKV